MDRQDLAQIYAGAIALLASTHPTEDQAESAIQSSVDAAFDVWRRVNGSAGEPKAPETPPVKGEIQYTDPDEVKGRPLTQQDLIDGGFMAPTPVFDPSKTQKPARRGKKKK